MKNLKAILFLFAVTCALPTFAAIACRPGLNNCPVNGEPTFSVLVELP